MPRQIRAGTLALLVIFGWGGTLCANPSHDDPQQLLAVHTDGAAEITVEASVLAREVAEELGEYESKLRESRLKVGRSTDIKQIGALATQIDQLKRLAQQLILLREPAGADLDYRARDFELRLRDVVVEYKKLPNVSQLIAAARSQYDREVAGGIRSLSRLGTLFKQGKVELAEKGIHEIYDDLARHSIWCGVSTNQRMYAKFVAPQRLIEKEMTERRTAQAEQLLENLRQQQAPDLTALPKRAQASIEAIQTSGKAEWDGQMLDGPDLLAAWASQWRKTHHAAVRTRAIDWARGQTSTMAQPSDLDRLEDAHSQFDQQMCTAVAELIAADAARAIPDATPILYQRYLQVLASISPQFAGASLRESVEPVLRSLREKSPLFAKQVDAYREATEELLRWRERVATDRAARRQEAAPPLLEVMNQAATQAALQARSDRVDSGVDQLFTSAPPLVNDMSRVALERQATLSDLAPEGEGSAISRYSQRHYARMPRVTLPEGEVADLKNALLVTDALEPLTLETAIAIRTAEDGYFQSAGGRVTGLQLESLLVHFIELPDDAAHVRIGPLPAEDPGSEPLRQLVWQFVLQPEWVRHEFIFADLP